MGERAWEVNSAIDYTTNDSQWVLHYLSLTLLVSEHICGNGFKSQHLVLQKHQASKLSKTFTEAVSSLGGCLGNFHWAVTICWIEHRNKRQCIELEL